MTLEWWQVGGAAGIAVGIIVLVVMVGKQVMGLTTQFFFKRIITTEYVSITACELHRKECRGNADSKAMRQAISLLIEYNDAIPIEKRVEIRNGLIT